MAKGGQAQTKGLAHTKKTLGTTRRKPAAPQNKKDDNQEQHEKESENEEEVGKDEPADTKIKIEPARRCIQSKPHPYHCESLLPYLISHDMVVLEEEKDFMTKNTLDEEIVEAWKARLGRVQHSQISGSISSIASTQPNYHLQELLQRVCTRVPIDQSIFIDPYLFEFL